MHQQRHPLQAAKLQWTDEAENICTPESHLKPYPHAHNCYLKKSFCFSISYSCKRIFQATESRGFGKLLPVWKILRNRLHQDRQKLRFWENDNKQAHMDHMIGQHGTEWMPRFFNVYLQRHKWTLINRQRQKDKNGCSQRFADKWSERSLWRAVTFPLPRS